MIIIFHYSLVITPLASENGVITEAKGRDRVMKITINRQGPGVGVVINLSSSGGLALPAAAAAHTLYSGVRRGRPTHLSH